MRTKEDLKMLQALPLEIKILKTQQRIREWVQFYGEDGVVVSFSGGKDSTVLLHLVRSLYPNVRAVFSDTGLEFPEIRNFVKTFDNVDWVRPKMTFGEIVTKYGYPLFSKEISNTIWYARKIRGVGEHNPLSTGDNGETGSTPPRTDQLSEEKTSRKPCTSGTNFNSADFGRRELKHPFPTGKRTGTSQFSTRKDTCLLDANFPF